MTAQLRRDPTDAAAEHLAAGRVAEAQALFEEVLQRQPTHARALCGLGSIALRRGEVDRGFDLIAHAATIAPEDGFTVSNLAVAYMTRNELPQAEDCCRRALDLEPGSPDLHANFATVLAARGALKQALVAQRHAVALAPDSAIQHFNLANILVASKDPAAAAAEYETVLDLDPGHTGALNNLALLHKQAGRLEKARALLDQARLGDPLNPELLANQADLMLRMGEGEQALEQIRRAVSLAPRAPLLQNSYGAMLLETGRIEEAGKVLADALRQAPDESTILFTLARLLRRQGRLDAAQAAVDRIGATGKEVSAAAALAGELLMMRGHHGEAWEKIASIATRETEPFTEADLGPEAELSGTAVRLVAFNGAASLFAARCLPALAARGVDVTVICPPVLAPLFDALPAVRMVVAAAELNLQSLGADSTPLMHLDTLPLRMRITPDLPSPDWPLFRITPATGAVKGASENTGLWWEGPGPRTALIDALSGTAGTTLISLQSGAARDAARPLLEAAGIADQGGGIGDFGALAREIVALDRVIAPDGPVAHLSAALGVETWVMVERDGSWYWPEAMAAAPWYPRTRVFRQAADGSWTAALADIRAALEAVRAQPATAEELQP